VKKEERAALRDSYDEMMQERENFRNQIMLDYQKLSYRDKLLFSFVVHFLADNPDTERSPQT